MDRSINRITPTVATAMKTTSFTTLYSYGVRRDAAAVLPVSVTQY